MTRSRVFDWRFIIALIFGAIVSYLIWVGVSAVHESAEKDKRIDQLIAVLEAEQLSGRLERVAATAERAVLLEKQDDLLDEVADLQRRQTLLLDYLRTHGISIPTAITAAPSTGKSSTGGDTPKAPGKAKGPKNKPGSKKP